MGKTLWGLEGRILSITTHALFGGALRSGLATPGSRQRMKETSVVDGALLNKAARRIAGANEFLTTLADVRSIRNHYFLKAANFLDRTLRAKGAAAKCGRREILRNASKYGNRLSFRESPERSMAPFSS